MKSTERHIEIENKTKEQLLEKAGKYSMQVARTVTKKEYAKHESSLAIAADATYQKNIQKKITHLKNAKYVVLIGIGGSNLGTEAVFSALAYYTSPMLLVLDGIDDEAQTELTDFIKTIDDVEELAVVVVSKSGTTVETMTNAVVALETLEEQFGAGIHKRTVFIGSEGTDFLKIGKKKKVTCLTFPDSIGGRYSVFSAVGIVPLSILGIDVISFCEGAEEALSKERRTQIVEHAVSLAGLGFKGIHTVNFFVFNDRLELLGYWYRQLLAESIGKRMTTDGTTFCHQLMPTVATDVDLHSMAQLYLGGYRGMYTHFVYGDVQSEHHTLTDHWLLDHMKMLKGHASHEIKQAIREGVFKAYDDQKLPYRFTELPKITAHELGLFMTSLMFEVMCVAHLFDVNAFDQPSVESYKKYTRKILADKTK